MGRGVRTRLTAHSFLSLRPNFQPETCMLRIGSGMIEKKKKSRYERNKRQVEYTYPSGVQLRGGARTNEKARAGSSFPGLRKLVCILY